MGMFDNFKKPNTDIPSNIGCFPPKQDGEHLDECPVIPKPENPHIKPMEQEIPFVDYNAEGDITGYWWYEGDQLNLEFSIEGEVIIGDSEEYLTAAEFLQNKTITLGFYNFRREKILSVDYPAATTITFEIDERITKLFRKGVYYCQLDLWDGIAFNRTIYKQEDCTLTVK